MPRPGWYQGTQIEIVRKGKKSTRIILPDGREEKVDTEQISETPPESNSLSDDFSFSSLMGGETPLEELDPVEEKNTEIKNVSFSSIPLENKEAEEVTKEVEESVEAQKEEKEEPKKIPFSPPAGGTRRILGAALRSREIEKQRVRDAKGVIPCHPKKLN